MEQKMAAKKENKAAAPQAKVNYRFTLYGKDVDLHDTELDLNHIRIDDQGALVKAIKG